MSDEDLALKANELMAEVVDSPKYQYYKRNRRGDAEDYFDELASKAGRYEGHLRELKALVGSSEPDTSLVRIDRRMQEQGLDDYLMQESTRVRVLERALWYLSTDAPDREIIEWGDATSLDKFDYAFNEGIVLVLDEERRDQVAKVALNYDVDVLVWRDENPDQPIEHYVDTFVLHKVGNYVMHLYGGHFERHGEILPSKS